MPHPFEIRPARADDCPGIARIQVDSYRSAYAGIFPQSYLDHFGYEEQQAEWLELLSASTRDLLLVAQTHEGELAGYALARAGPTSLPPYDAELVALHVRQPFQRQGIGRQPVCAVAAALAASGCTSLLLWVLEANPARAFYERLGATPLDACQDAMGAREVAYGWPDIRTLLSSL